MTSSRFRQILMTSGALVAVAGSAWAAGPQEIDARKLFQDNCATCHGADRGGYIAPALHKDTQGALSEMSIRGMIMTGVPDTLMPPWAGRLSDEEIRALATLIKTQPKDTLEWTLDDIRASVQVLVDEKTLPAKPAYTADVMDLMAVTARGRYANGPESKLVLLDGKTNTLVAEIPTGNAPHIVDYHPTNPRWAYLKTDNSTVLKIDLYSMQVVRKVRTGLSGPSLAVSADGKWLMTGAFVPGSVVILNADTLDPVKYITLEGTDYNGDFVQSASGMVIASPVNNLFAIAVKHAGQVWIVDPNAPDMPITKIEKVGRFLHDAVLSGDGRYVMIADYRSNKVAVIDLKEKKHVKDIPAGCQPHLGSGSITRVGTRDLAFGTNFGTCDLGSLVTVWDMKDFSVVKQIKVSGSTESPAAHPDAPYVAVDIVSQDRRARYIDMIDKNTLEVVKRLDAGGHSYFPEYTRDGRFLYVSSGYTGDRLKIYDSKTLELIVEYPVQSPAGIFAHARTLWLTKGLPERKGATQ